MVKYLIIGGSAGGVGAVEAIREADPTGTIALISEEPFPQYSRPMISEFVSQEATLATMKYRSEQFWKKHNVHAYTGKTAVKVDFDKKIVELDDGQKLEYEKLLLATGGTPAIPQMDGITKDGVFTFTELASAEGITSKLEHAKSAVVIGGGLIGVSVADALVKRGIKITLVEVNDRLIHIVLDEKASHLAENVIKATGTKLVFGQTVKQILGKQENPNEVVGVLLQDDTVISCDLVILAVGVNPRVELVENSKVDVKKGIIVDRFMQTNVPDVYACGDATEAHDFLVKENRRLPLWPLAHVGGRVAGYNMAGQTTEYEGGTVMSSMNYFRLPIISVGQINPEDSENYEILVDVQPEKPTYKKIVLKDDVIVGFIFLGEVEKAGILFRLIKNHVNIGEVKEKLLSKDFGIISLPEAIRKEMFVVH
ncbi:MAG: NAD(P)/FAD-dependent oxidoreductase [archaeon]